MDDLETGSNGPLIKVAFGASSSGLVANYEGSLITPSKDGWMPEEGMYFVCEKPLLENVVLYIIAEQTPVFEVFVLPWIVTNLNDRVVELRLTNSGLNLVPSNLPLTNFGKEAILYSKIGETKYVFVKNSQYVHAIMEALDKREDRKDNGGWSMLAKRPNLLVAPNQSMFLSSIAKVVDETIKSLQV